MPQPPTSRTVTTNRLNMIFSSGKVRISHGTEQSTLLKQAIADPTVLIELERALVAAFKEGRAMTRFRIT